MTGLRRLPNLADCLVCGAELTEVETRIVRWREPIDGHAFDTIPRCVDRAACRDRLEATGDAWPIADGTPATVRRREPMPTLAAPPAVAIEEERTWFD